MATVFRNYTADELQAQYSARAAVPEHPDIFKRWQAWSKTSRNELNAVLDLPYGEGQRERLDLFLPTTDEAPVMLFIHGGYWQALDKSDFSFLARELVNNGVAVAIMNYSHCPHVSLDQIVLQARKALGWLGHNASGYGLDPRKIDLCGHSAGGQLVAMMMTTQWDELDAVLPDPPFQSVISISGVFELEPLIFTQINDALHLNLESAHRNSPLLREPEVKVSMTLAVGGEESEEFHRQSRALSDLWSTKGIKSHLMNMPGLNHFTAVEQLADVDSALFQQCCRQILDSSDDQTT